MVQMNKLKDGAGKGAWRVLFGDYGTLAFEFIYVPFWFMEGDAVTMETALTKGGRGRLPYFSLWHRGLNSPVIDIHIIRLSRILRFSLSQE
jgi:hypothetical protein